MHCNRAINKISSILGCRHKVDSSKDTIDMNYHNARLISVSIDIWLYQPVSCILIRFQAHKRKPLYKSTWILFVSMPKGEEKKYTSYFKPTRSVDARVSVDKNTVIACRALSP